MIPKAFRNLTPPFSCRNLWIFGDILMLTEHLLSIMATKGSVTVWDQRGRLHLRFRHQGKQHRPALGLGNTPVDWAVARSIAARIEGDLKTGNFDPTLAKYGIGLQRSGGVLTDRALIERYCKSQKDRLDPGSLKKYRAILADLDRAGLAETDSRQLTRDDGAKLIRSMGGRLALITVRHRIESLSTVWRWGVEQGLVGSVPWVVKDVRGIAPQPPKPFSLEEIRLIANWLDENQSPAAGFFRFQIGTGCRTGEVIGLLWRHVSDDCRQVWIGEAVVQRTRKSVKNRKPRLITLPPSLQKWLAEYRKARGKIDPVFPDPQGRVWTASQLNWYWRKPFTALGIPYRRPYVTRKTLISHLLQHGKSPVEIANSMGHSVKTLFTYYADLVGNPELIDLLD